MDTKSLKCKHPKKIITSMDNDKHEVFVLPPDILKKLGISIGNINVSQVADSNDSHGPEVTSDQHNENFPALNCSQNPSDTSILETASLMKKSVFLSPTFIPTVANVIPGEVEFVNKKKKEGSISVKESEPAQSSVFVPVDNFEAINLLPQDIDHQLDDPTVDQAHMSYNNVVNGGDKDYKHMPLEGHDIQAVDFNNICNENQNTMESHCNYSDVAHSVQSNSNLEFSENLTDCCSTQISENVSTSDTDKPVSKLSKIKIISEETIPLSKLRDLKRLPSNINDLTPVTVIGNKVYIESSHSKEQNIQEQSPQVVSERTDLLHIQSSTVKSEVIVSKSNFKSIQKAKCIQIHAASSVISSQLAEVTGCKQNIILNKNDNINTSETKHFEGSSCTVIKDNHKKGAKRILESKTSSEGTHDFNETNKAISDAPDKTLEDSVPVNAPTVNGFHRHDMDSSGIHENEMDIDRKSDVSCIENKDDEYKNKGDSVEQLSSSKTFFYKKDTGTKSNLKRKSKSKNIQIHISKTTVDNEDRKKINSDIKPETHDNISSLKNRADETLTNNELANILNATKELSNSHTDVKVDKVKEIAAYLKKFSHIYTDKKKIKKDLNNDNNKKETINSNINTIESKLCIQGVEKPGGKYVEREHSGECKVLKTYTRRNLPEKSNLLAKISEICDSVDASAHELNTVEVSTSREIQEFCICNDFGQLEYYDYDGIYEHIHFWQNNTAKYELDLIFSIYSDDSIAYKNDSGLEEESNTEEKEEVNICWNVFPNEFPEDLDASESDKIWASDELKNVGCGDSLEVPELYNKAQEQNSTLLSKTQDNLLANNLNFDNILEIVDHDMINTAESKNSDTKHTQNKENILNMYDSSAVVATSDSESVNTETSTLEPKLITTSLSLTESSEISNEINKLFQTPVDDRRVIEGNKYKTKEDTNEINKQKLDNTTEKCSKEDLPDLPRTYGKIAPKRTLSAKLSPEKISKSVDQPPSKKSIKCGLCNNLFCELEWEEHVTNHHQLIAWRAGGSIDLDNPRLLKKLKRRLRTFGVLKCSICSMTTKQFNKFIEHIKYCVHMKLSNTNNKTDKPSRKSRIASNDNVTCGVCQQTLQSSDWLEHIGRNHAYLAWMRGQEALDFEKESVVLQHLQNIIRVNGNLVCYKCGFNRQRAKLYLAHIKTCDGSETYLNKSSASVNLNTTSDLTTSIIENNEDLEQPAETASVKCAVCSQDVENLKWIEHIAKEHNYLAWQKGDTPVNLDDEEDVWNHLQQFIREHGGLICYKCGLTRRRVKLYLTHVELCDGTGSHVDISSNISMNSTAPSTDDWYEVPIVSEDRKIVKCGVCSLEVPILEWIQHIGEEHDYLAWQEGSPPLDLEDESAIRLYLLNISRQSGGLICRHCKKILKYPKTYLQHIKECSGVTETVQGSSFSEPKIKNGSVTCGVCSKNLEMVDWLHHIQIEHRYMAWIEGQPPLDSKDSAMVQRHLYDICKQLGGLECTKCGLKRKYVKSYLSHIQTCEQKMVTGELNLDMMSKGILECALCAEKVEPKDWRSHAMKNHYNIAWVVGDVPIEINNPYSVEPYLKEYHQRYNLVCKVCGISRVSYVGFYAHIIICGKSDEETEIYKSTCDICHNKYLRIYKSQHMTMHREKEYAMERKLLAAKEKELKNEDETEDPIIQTGRRRAAEKAKTVIEKYKSGFQNGSYHCSKCGFSSDIEKELSDHVCVENKWGDANDSDESVKLDNYSEDESDETDIDSNVSEEEQEARENASPSKKKRYSDTTQTSRISRLPYEVGNISGYMKKSTEEFAKMYLTDEPLFTQWRSCEFEEISESEVMKYMPPIEESCKVRFDSDEDWISFKRFESNRIKDTVVMFAGASIQCMSWAPAAGADAPQYVALATHAAADAPRLAWDAQPTAPALLQIWHCGNVIATMPEFVLGIVHDYGTVWAFDWCPSGARDAMPELAPESKEMHRLGLLAVACSNGSAYIFCVPYPASITEKDKLFYRLKPVVEMRLTTNENRKGYQATAIKWSPQKGHSHIVVGYADGSTAFYDLDNDSPLLRTTENNITVLYPYHDERVQNSCIEDVDMYPSGAVSSARAGGVVCVGSAGGASAGPLQSHVAAARVLFPPHWPAALLAGDDCLVNQSINELEWWGGGRRLGGMRGAAGCAWCGRLAAAALPLLRLLKVHPVYPELHKQVVGTIQMTPLGGKRKRQNDELAMIVEPITYSDAVKKYGIEFKQITAKDRPTQQKLSAMPRDAYPERFPLSDVAAMQFCPSFKLHHKLALALHSGLVVIINI